MRRVLAVFMSSIFLVACGIDATKYEDFDFIDVKDPFDEFALIEHAMKVNREDILKPGFITDNNGFDMSFQSIRYNGASDELLHRVNYTHAGSNAFLSFTAEKNTPDEHYQEKIDRLQDAKPLEDPNLTGFYGFTKEDGEHYYAFAAKEEDVFYFFENSRSVSEGYDAAFTQLISQSLKTETDGANYHFYQRFAFDIDQLHFPLFHKDVVSNVEVEIYDVGYWGFENPNSVEIRYDLDDYDTSLHYSIDGMDHFSRNVGFIPVEEGETEHGIHVTEYESDMIFSSIYVWERDEHTYSISLITKEEVLTTEDVYAIIDSSVDDTRQFTNKNIFKETNEEPELDDIDQEILDRLSELGE